MRERLYRSREDRVLSGVCGGIADSLDLDPSLVRIVFALLGITGGIGLLLYIVMALVVPEEPYYIPTAAAPGGAGPTATSADADTAAGTADPAPGMAPGMAAGSVAAPAGASPTGPGSPGPTPGPGAAPMTGAYPPGAWMTEREARRAARRETRPPRRADHDGRAGLIFGAILVLIGVWFLVSRYIPALDGAFLGPIILIAIGAIVLAGALRRNEDDGPAKPR